MSLRTIDGRILDQEREPLLGVRPIAERGWWLFWVGAIRVPSTVETGRYVVVAQLSERNGRRLGTETTIGTVEVP